MGGHIGCFKFCGYRISTGKQRYTQDTKEPFIGEKIEELHQRFVKKKDIGQILKQNTKMYIVMEFYLICKVAKSERGID